MEDTLVSFEVAKLLKEKGFKDTIGLINGKHYYNYRGELDGDQTDYLKARVRKEDLVPFKNYSAPTLSLIQKWLREVHKIHITIDHVDTTTNYYYDYTLVTANDREYNDEDFTDQAKHHYNWGKEFEYETYELALQQGILEALKLIK